MRTRPRPLTAPLLGGLLAVSIAAAGFGPANPGSADPARPVEATPEAVAGCDILILWHTYRGAMDYDRAQVRVRGAPTWAKVRGSMLDFIGQIGTPPVLPLTNGRVWNWRESLKQEGCAKDRRYRFRIYAPPQTAEPVTSNRPYTGTERWIYFPSETGWTRNTHIDLGFLDLCIMDGTKCGRPYYPNGAATPVLKSSDQRW